MKKRIAFCINQIGDGGAERVIVGLANYFFSKGYEVYMITSFVCEQEYDLDKGIRRIVLSQRFRKKNALIKNIGWIKEIRRLCKTEKIECIVGFLRESSVRVILSTIGLDTLSVFSVRGNPQYEYEGLTNKLIKNILLPVADGAVFQTKAASMSFSNRIQKKSTVIPNGMGDDFFKIERRPIRNLVVAVGRLDSVKNFPMLIKSIQQAKQAIKDIKLEIYGIGEEENHLKELIEELELTDNIRLMGATKEIDMVYEKADLFVLSSDHEGMPNALMEALAAGVPCISTDCPVGAPGWLLNGGECGLLVPVNDSEKMAEAIVKLLLDRELLQSYGQKGKEWVSQFKLDKIHSEWEEYINTL